MRADFLFGFALFSFRAGGWRYDHGGLARFQGCREWKRK